MNETGECRSCGLSGRIRVLSLGHTPLANALLTADQLVEPEKTYPLKALATAATLCRGTMIIAQELPDVSGPQAAMLYIGGDRLGEDTGVWWMPNRTCLEQMLKKLGFREVSLVGEYSGFMRPFGIPYRRQIIHAAR